MTMCYLKAKICLIIHLLFYCSKASSCLRVQDQQTKQKGIAKIFPRKQSGDETLSTEKVQHTPLHLFCHFFLAKKIEFKIFRYTVDNTLHYIATKTSKFRHIQKDISQETISLNMNTKMTSSCHANEDTEQITTMQGEIGMRLSNTCSRVKGMQLKTKEIKLNANGTQKGAKLRHFPTNQNEIASQDRLSSIGSIG